MSKKSPDAGEEAKVATLLCLLKSIEKELHLATVVTARFDAAEAQEPLLLRPLPSHPAGRRGDPGALAPLVAALTSPTLLSKGRGGRKTIFDLLFCGSLLDELLDPWASRLPNE